MVFDVPVNLLRGLSDPWRGHILRSNVIAGLLLFNVIAISFIRGAVVAGAAGVLQAFSFSSPFSFFMLLLLLQFLCYIVAAESPYRLSPVSSHAAQPAQEAAGVAVKQGRPGTVGQGARIHVQYLQ